MSTDNTNIAQLESVAGELTDLIKQNSLAFQVCGVQYSSTPKPLLFGVRQRSGSKGFEIVKTTPTAFTSSDSEGFSEEVIDDVFNLFGDDAIEYFKTIGSNDIADSIDAEIVTHLNSVATVGNALTLDFTAGVGLENGVLLQNLLVKINKERLIIANNIKRGFPSVIIASPNVCSLLLTQKMLSNDAAMDADKSRSNVKYVGRMADADVFQDINAASDYCLITHKTYVPGDAGVILTPLYDPKFQAHRDAEGAGFTFHYKQRFAYGSNPLDVAGAGNSEFTRKFAITLTGFDAL